MQCPNCNAPLNDESAFCPNCGQPVPAAAPAAAEAAAAAAGVAAAAVDAAAPAPSAPGGEFVVPDYQKQFYEQQAQKQAQPGYQPAYQAAAPQPREFPEPATSRALAMCLYVGLLPMIFGLVVRDKSDPFITFHLNQAVVVFIGSIVSAILSAIIIGVILGIFVFVCAIMGMVSAYKGEQNEMPLLGKIKIIS